MDHGTHRRRHQRRRDTGFPTGAMEEVLAGHPAVAEWRGAGAWADALKGQLPLGTHRGQGRGGKPRRRNWLPELVSLMREKIGAGGPDFKQALMVKRLPKDPVRQDPEGPRSAAWPTGNPLQGTRPPSTTPVILGRDQGGPDTVGATPRPSRPQVPVPGQGLTADFLIFLLDKNGAFEYIRFDIITCKRVLCMVFGAGVEGELRLPDEQNPYPCPVSTETRLIRDTSFGVSGASLVLFAEGGAHVPPRSFGLFCVRGTLLGLLHLLGYPRREDGSNGRRLLSFPGRVFAVMGLRAGGDGPLRSRGGTFIGHPGLVFRDGFPVRLRPPSTPSPSPSRG